MNISDLCSLACNRKLWWQVECCQHMLFHYPDGYLAIKAVCLDELRCHVMTWCSSETKCSLGSFAQKQCTVDAAAVFTKTPLTRDTVLTPVLF